MADRWEVTTLLVVLLGGAACEVEDGVGPQLERISLSGATVRLEFAGTLEADAVPASAFRISVGRSDGVSTTYFDPEFFFDAESFSCCDLACGPYNFTNADCESTGSQPDLPCSSCTRVGPAGVMTVVDATAEDNTLLLTLPHELTTAAYAELASESSLLFAHYRGGVVLDMDGEKVRPFGADWVNVETSPEDLDSYRLVEDGDFPLVPREIGWTPDR